MLRCWLVRRRFAWKWHTKCCQLRTFLVLPRTQSSPLGSPLQLLLRLKRKPANIKHETRQPTKDINCNRVGSGLSGYCCRLPNSVEGRLQLKSNTKFKPSPESKNPKSVGTCPQWDCGERRSANFLIEVPGLGDRRILHRKAIRFGFSSSSPSDTKGSSGLLFALLEHKNQVSVKIARAKAEETKWKTIKY